MTNRDGRPSRLDSFDVRILAALQRSGRITKTRLAQEIGLSPSPCWERMRRLENDGLIRGYHAEIELDHLVQTVTVMVEVTLHSHTSDDFQRFEQGIVDVDEIIECCATGGGIDYLLKVVALDIDHYQRVIDRLLLAEIGIDRYFTYIVTKVIKASSGAPVIPLLRHAGDSRVPRG